MAFSSFDTVEQCVDQVLQNVGKRIVLGIPMAIGKPNHLVNAFYQRACEDSSIELTILTALSLMRPQGKSALEQRFLKPFVDRIYQDYPDLDYMSAMHSQTLPDNIKVVQFFFKPGDCLRLHDQQRQYISSNYTDVARAFINQGVNVVAQALAKKTLADGNIYYSFSSNPDVSLQLLPLLMAERAKGRAIATVGVVNRQMPFMHNDAICNLDHMDMMVDNPRYDHTLFSTPNMPITPTDYAIGMYASALIKDGGTLQIGIGSLGDAITYACLIRHKHNQAYQRILEHMAVNDRYGELLNQWGGVEPFAEGLYGSSEMLVNGFLHLYQQGILKRKVVDHVGLQRVLNEGHLTEQITLRSLDILAKAKIISQPLVEQDLKLLQRFGFIRREVSWQNQQLRLDDQLINPDWHQQPEVFQTLLGDRLRGGVVMHGGFFLGPRSMYQALHDFSARDHEAFCMTGVDRVNQLFGDETLRSLQRQDGRFINTCLMITLTGAAVSDGLDDGRVVSGVGGQYDFINMANKLDGARSVLMLRSHRIKDGQIQSNIVWNYAHNTIPRHLRDLVITEYGIADLRDKSDQQIIMALLNITDSRFQDELLAQAKAANKIDPSYRIAEIYRHNTPERVRRQLKDWQKQEFFPVFPFGCDFTDEELVLGKALKSLKAKTSHKGRLLKTMFKAMEHQQVIPDGARPYLARLQLDKPQGVKEHLLQRLVLHELQQNGVLGGNQTK